MDEKINILIVDDSVVIRKIITKVLGSEANFNVFAQAEDGQEALDVLNSNISKLDVHLIVLDIEMPKMDGFTALPLIRRICPRARVLIASTLTQKGAEASIKALTSGASDYIPKPSADGESANFIDFSRDLVTKVKILGKASAKSYAGAVLLGTGTSAAARPITTSAASANKTEESFALKPDKAFRPAAIAIGSSTGGPEALHNYFKAINKAKISNVPIFITQHMPPKFTTLLAANIERNSGVRCAEGIDGEEIVAGRAYLAPGDFHMTVIERGGKRYIKLNQEPQVNFCRPSVEPMLDSLSQVYGAKLFFTMLTGMGADGAEAAKRAEAKGAYICAQDRESSVVWGMPGATAKLGICSMVAPIDELVRNLMARL